MTVVPAVGGRPANWSKSACAQTVRKRAGDRGEARVVVPGSPTEAGESTRETEVLSREARDRVRGTTSGAEGDTAVLTHVTTRVDATDGRGRVVRTGALETNRSEDLVHARIDRLAVELVLERAKEVERTRDTSRRGDRVGGEDVQLIVGHVPVLVVVGRAGQPLPPAVDVIGGDESGGQPTEAHDPAEAGRGDRETFSNLSSSDDRRGTTVGRRDETAVRDQDRRGTGETQTRRETRKQEARGRSGRRSVGEETSRGDTSKGTAATGRATETREDVLVVGVRTIELDDGDERELDGQAHDRRTEDTLAGEPTLLTVAVVTEEGDLVAAKAVAVHPVTDAVRTADGRATGTDASVDHVGAIAHDMEVGSILSADGAGEAHGQRAKRETTDKVLGKRHYEIPRENREEGSHISPMREGTLV